MTILFTPNILFFSGSVLAGSATVVRGTYTVPVGKRSVLRYSSLRGNANANAALTTFAFIDIVKNAVSNEVLRRDLSGAAIQLNAESRNDIDLFAGDSIRLVTINNGVAAVVMQLQAFYTEWA